MRKVILLLGLVLQVIIVDAQSVSGSLVDEKGNPVSFANVVLLSSKDSSFVQGTISNEQGIFRYLLKPTGRRGGRHYHPKQCGRSG